jgi:hypothetical protein
MYLQAAVANWRENFTEETACMPPCNEVMESTANVLVYVRCRPVLATEDIGGSITDIVSLKYELMEFEAITTNIARDCDVFVHTEESYLGAPTGCLKTKCYRVHRAYGPNTEEIQLYQSAIQPQVRSFCEGKNAWCISYGLTASGKTHTSVSMYNFVATELLHMSLCNGWSLLVSMIEIRGDEAFDLLTVDTEGGGGGAEKAWERVAVREDAHGHIHASSRKEVLRTAEDIAECLKVFQAHRATASTACNQSSSRSHAIISFNLSMSNGHGLNSSAANERVNEETSFRIVDLAGSERQRYVHARCCVTETMSRA